MNSVLKEHLKNENGKGKFLAIQYEDVNDVHNIYRKIIHHELS